MRVVDDSGSRPRPVARTGAQAPAPPAPLARIEPPAPRPTLVRGPPPGTFEFSGRTYEYLRHGHNNARGNERTVEVPIAMAEVRACAGRILEIGNVLSGYGPAAHTIVDKYEQAPGVLNVDVIDYVGTAPYDLIVSVSTLEHVGFEEEGGDQEKILRAVEHLRALLTGTGRLVVTLPLGWNVLVDRYIDEGRLGFDEVRCLRRATGDSNEWREVAYAEARGTRYGDPFPNANAIAVGFARR